jgi:hypothetical protein
MTRATQTGRGPKGNPYYRNPKKAGDAFQSNDRKLSQGGKFFRNFHRTKTKAFMTSYDDIQHLTIYKLCLSVVTAGDPQTAFNNLLDKAWEIGCKTGNIKDLDTTQEANWKTWVQNWVRIAWDIMSQLRLRPFLPAFTESSTTDTSDTALAIWSQSDWDAFLSSLEKLDCPDFIYRLCQPFQWYIKMTEGYEKAGLEVPPSYFIPTVHREQLTDLATLREAAKAVSSNAMIHSKKFGIPFSKFSTDKLKSQEVLRKDVWDSQDILAFFNIVPLQYYNNDPAEDTLTPFTAFANNNKTTDYTNAKYAFNDSKPMSILHALFPLFGTYGAVNNDIGGIFEVYGPATAEYDFNVFKVKLLGTSWDGITVSGGADNNILKLFASAYNGDATRAFAWTGTKVTANQTLDFEDWIAFDQRPDLYIGTSVKYEEIHDCAENAVKYMVYGE